MSIQIRSAQKDDCRKILNLIHELAIHEKAPKEVSITTDYLVESGFSGNPAWNAFVAEVEGEIVAFALYYFRFSTWKGEMLYLEDLIVTESMRGKGIGSMLFERLIKETKEQKLSGMSWQVREENGNAINFYKKYNAQLEGNMMNASIYL